MTVERPTEIQCQATIVEAAKLFGWRIHATRPARSAKGWRTPIQGHAGFPDLVLARGPDLLFVELKRKPNRIEPDQQAWHDALAAAGATVHVVWVPEGMPQFLAGLAARTGAAA